MFVIKLTILRAPYFVNRINNDIRKKTLRRGENLILKITDRRKCDTVQR